MSPPVVAARGLLDTSVFIARESGRPLVVDRFPDEVAISVITLAELHAGVLAASDLGARARRLATLDAVADVAVIVIDEAAAAMWARLRVWLAERGARVGVNDLWIAASAMSLGLPVVTQDRDFDVLEPAGVEVIRV